MRYPATRHAPPRAAAFSLVELVIVVAVLGIIGAIAAPKLGQTDTAQAAAAARLLVADLEHAQACSIQRRAPALAGLTVYPDGTGYRLGTVDDDLATPLTHPSAGTPLTVTFGEGRAQGLERVTLTATQLNGEDHVVFDPFGAIQQSTSDDVVLTLTAGDASINVTIDATNGRVTVGDLY